MEQNIGQMAAATSAAYLHSMVQIFDEAVFANVFAYICICKKIYKYVLIRYLVSIKRALILIFLFVPAAPYFLSPCYEDFQCSRLIFNFHCQKPANSSSSHGIIFVNYVPLSP
jgi:hypothetical protein